MARIARIVVPDCPHLILQRGNRGGRLFFSTADRARYLEILSGWLVRYRIRLWAYRLRAGEVTMLVVPPAGRALGDALRNAHGRYSQIVNRRQQTTGHLFQGRFYSCPLDEHYLAVALRRLERFTGRMPAATASSTACHCLGRAGGAALADGLALLATVPDWRKWLAQPIDPTELDHLAGRLRVGKPAGGPAFVRRVEQLTGLDLSRPQGRPRRIRPVEPAGDAP